ncbi:MAG: hypothetical protein Q9213_003265 [Squamulea squamosa]
MTTQIQSRQAFIKSLGDFMKLYGFQGVDLDWEYPSAVERGGSINDAGNYVALIREMRVAWNKDYGISATLAPGIYLRGFDPKGMELHVDFFTFLSYDLLAPSSAEGTARPHTDIREIEKGIVALSADKLDSRQFNMALKNYGRGYTLADPKCTHAGCKVSGPSKPGPCMGQAGILSNIEISDIAQQRHLKAQLVPNSMSKEISWEDQWIGFDDPETLAMKTHWAAENCLGGTVLWSLDMNSGEGSGSRPGPVPVIPLIPAAPGKSTSLAPIQTPAAALIVPGVATVPSPTIFPGAMVTEGATAVLGLEAIANLVQSKAPKSADVVATLGTLAAIYASQQLLNKEAAMLNIGSLPEDAKKAIESVKKTLPGIQGGTKEAIMYLTDSIKNPATVNKDDLRKPDGLLGQQGSVTKQVAPSLKQLADWKTPKGSNDVILSGILTLHSPSLGDNWRGTTIPGILTVPSPTIRWEKALLMANNAPGSSNAAGGSGGAGGGGGDGGNGGAAAGSLLSGLLSLAKQAEDAVNSLANAVTGLSGKCQPDLDSCPISFPHRISDLVSQLTSATEDVGCLGAGLDAIELDAWPPADINRVVAVQNANRNLFNILKSNLNDLARVINNPTQALQVLKKQSPGYVAGGAVLALSSQLDSASISALPWVAVATEKEKAKDEYFLVTVEGTTVKAYKDFIRTLPDKGVGEQRLYDWSRVYQTYLGRMTRDEASAINGHPLVAVIGSNRKKTRRWNERVITKRMSKRSSHSYSKVNGTKLVSRVNPSWTIRKRPESDLHLRMLSYDPQSVMYNLQSQPAEDPRYDYQYEQTMGKGATTYIYDDGFEFKHGEFSRGQDLKPEMHVPTSYGNVPLWSGSDHGDRVASLAVGGAQNGVASQASLVGVKAWDITSDETIKGA